VKILFWNLKGKDLTEMVCDLVKTTEADIVVLNECGAGIARLRNQLRKRVDERFFVPQYNPQKSRFHCLTKEAALNLCEVDKTFRSSIRQLVFQSTEILLGLVHGVDAGNYNQPARDSEAQTMMTQLRMLKQRVKHNHVILIGDFNLNPFDWGMNLAAGFNAMMTRECIQAGQRGFVGNTYDFFYNPMWSKFGDGTDGPSGTIYNISGQGVYGWNMFDQVILSYSVVEWFKEVQILTHTGTESLIDSSGRPNSNMASDHLPILVEFKGDSHG